MPKNKKKKNNNIEKRIYLIAGIIFSLYFLLLTISAVFFENRFGLNAKIAGVSVALKTRSEAIDLVSNGWQAYEKSKIEIGGSSFNTADLVKKLDSEKSVDNALVYQQKNYLSLAVLRGFRSSAKLSLNDDTISEILLTKYGETSVPPENARIELNGKAKIILEKRGQRLLLPESREKITTSLGQFEKNADLKIIPLDVSLTGKEAESLIAIAERMVAEPLVLTSKQGNFGVSANELKTWLTITPKEPRTDVLNEQIIPAEETASFYFFDQPKVNNYIQSVAQKINQSPANAQLSAHNGQINIIKPAVIGYILDELDATEKIQALTPSSREVALKIIIQKPEVREDNLSHLGIKELISTGWTNFVGSPNNRIHNIRTGASKFNGALIKPNENFFFNETLGPVESYTGYLPELVILQNKTVPQYGGGLCQVSSTAFRAALNAGFPILERTLHAYPVSYYRPYGVDATIYLPKPDLVFTNDSGNYVLIQTRIEGVRLYFDFYGTKPVKTIKFAGNSNATNTVYPVEQVTPSIYEQGARGRGSFTASFVRFIYDAKNSLIRKDVFTSKYDSPAKFPH